MKVEKSDKRLNISLDLIKNKMSLLLSAIGILLFIVGYSLWDFIDNNQKITIFCVKDKNECIIESKKILFGVQKQKLSFDKIGEAQLHKVGCRYLTCYYNIHIPYGNSYLKLYSSSENEKVLQWLIENFNSNKNNMKVNSFELNIDRAPVFLSTLSLYIISWFPFLLIVILFFFNIRITIIADKEQKLLIIENKRIIGRQINRIPLDRIKDIEINKFKKYCIKYCIVNYRLKSGVDYEIFRLENEAMSENIVKQIKEFIFDEKE